MPKFIEIVINDKEWSETTSPFHSSNPDITLRHCRKPFLDYMIASLAPALPPYYLYINSLLAYR
jgi:hypothetical protein